MWRSRLKSQNRAGDRLSSLRPIKWEKQVAGQFIWDTTQYSDEKNPTKVYIYEDLNMWESMGEKTLWGNTLDKKSGSPRKDIEWPRDFLYELEHSLIEQLCVKESKVFEFWKSLSCVWLSATPWLIQSMEFSRTEYWSG